MKNYLLTIAGVIFLTTFSKAQQGSVTGIVLNRSTQLPVSAASVQIQNTETGTVTDSAGDSDS
jgi:hypothetical protein